jgi:hypothetical protein
MFEIYQILSLYKSIQLCLINEKGRILLNSVNCLDDIDFNKLTKRNLNNGIYFIPPAESNILFLDDLTTADAIPYQSIIVQTSSKKFQAHIFTDKIMPPEQRTKLQRVLIRQFNADLRATSGMQPRRLPGFTNQKYPERPLVKIVKNTIFNPNVPVLDISKIYIEEPKSIQHAYSSPKSNHLKKFKSWNDFFTGDSSSADIRYVLYLCRQGWTDDAIRAQLLAESNNLSQRKSGHIEDYLDRTILKARSYFI